MERDLPKAMNAENSMKPNKVRELGFKIVFKLKSGTI